MKIPSQISADISTATQRPFQLQRATPVGGGSICESFRIEDKDGTSYFLKLNAVRHHPLPSAWLRTGFIAEAAGLSAIAATGTVRVPCPVTQGCADGLSYLALEHLDLHPHGDAKALGAQLATLHRNSAPAFGFAQDNFIGSTAQPNSWSQDWIGFWRERRLGHQLELATRNGYGGELQRAGADLLDVLPAFFDGYTPQPSLLHGDLWGGNHAYLADGTPVIFDPACYYGDRECDLAMTELFGGFSADFYTAYTAAWPLDTGYTTRRDLYNLYHILNHANLFGGSYVKQAAHLIQRLLFMRP